METDDLSKLESRVYRLYTSDGAYEFVVGSGLALYALVRILGLNPLTLLVLPVYLLLVRMVWRTRITYPRLGYARFRSELRKRERQAILRWTLFSLGILVIGLVLFMSWKFWKLTRAVQAMNQTTQAPMPDFSGAKLIGGAALTVVLAGVGYRIKATRFYVVAVLTFLFYAASYFLKVDAIYALGATGVALTITGLIQARRFVRENPRLEGEVADERAS